MDLSNRHEIEVDYDGIPLLKNPTGFFAKDIKVSVTDNMLRVFYNGDLIYAMEHDDGEDHSYHYGDLLDEEATDFWTLSDVTVADE